MDDFEFPLPESFEIQAKDAVISIRCESSVKNELWELVPDQTIRMAAVNRLLKDYNKFLRAKKSEKSKR